MKLYFATGTCSLSPRIVAEEAGITLDADRVNIGVNPHRTSAGVDFSTIHPNGYVPALELDDGSLLTEGAAIVQYLADLNPGAGLIAPAGTMARYRQQSWLNFIATELHKMYSPWLFHPEYGDQAQAVARSKLAERLAYVESELSRGSPYLTPAGFSVADAYLFAIVSWSAFARVGLDGFPRLREFMALVGARSAVRRAMRAEGMKVAD
jgi:glutathione S-transferase